MNLIDVTVYAVVMMCLLWIVRVDLKKLYIPDLALLLLLICKLILWSMDQTEFSQFIWFLTLAVLISFILIIANLIFIEVTDKLALGWGDVKLLFVLHLYLGELGLWNLALASLVFFLTSKKQQQPQAFSPYIIGSFLVLLVFT